MRLKLMNRDWNLLLGLYTYTMLSFRQISENYFPGNAKATIHNRLTQLEHAGLLRRFRLGRVIHHAVGQELGVVFLPTRLALKFLQAKQGQEIFRTEPVPLNTASLYHDLLLSDVMLALKRRFPEHILTHGKNRYQACEAQSRFPDALANDPYGEEEWAIELELTAKSEKRYRQILMQYQVSNAYSKVIYVFGQRNIKEKVSALLTHQPVPGFANPSTGKFYFVYLWDLLKDSRSVPVSNGAEGLISEPSLFNILKREEENELSA